MAVLRINLLATPRNISTALMYSFAQRKDTVVVDEPLYAHYLIQSNAEHPGRQETIASMENDGEMVVRTTLLGRQEKPVLFIKNMTHHLINLDLSFLNQMKNLFLIRDPYEMLTSYTKVNPNPKMSDIGIKMQFDLYSDLLKSGNVATLVDAKTILESPEKMLPLICQKLEIEFTKDMLQWEAGARKEDGVWAKYWYGSVHQSSGFQAYQKKTDILPEHIVPLYNEAKPYYDFLLRHSLKIT